MNDFSDCRIIYETKGLCPVCCQWVDAQAIENCGKVFLRKTCPEHGQSDLLICGDASSFRQLREAYLITHNEIFPQSRYLLYLTPVCNMSCPICFLSRQKDQKQDITLEELNKTLSTPKRELILFGAEPTCREDLPQIIEFLKRRQFSVSLYTNGLNLSDLEYAKVIKAANVDKIYFQFDSFNDEVYEKLRQKKLLDIKNKALNNLKLLDIPVVLDITVVNDLNDHEVGKIFDFACRQNHISALNFIAYVRSGGGSEFLNDNVLMPDDIIKRIGDYTQGRINRDKIKVYQKLLYIYMSILKRRTCFYIQYFWVYRRDEGEYLTLDEIIDFGKLDNVLDGYLRLAPKTGKMFAIAYLVFKSPVLLFALKQRRICFEMFRMAFAHSFNKAEYAKKSSKFLQLIFTTACDPYKSDINIAKRCHVGMIYKNDQGELKIDDENGMYLLQEEINSKIMSGKI
ncbi:MAG: radical SAM protein [Candidatus Omnitrophica bacterium]|nr:radical SAM protein [Candidatus Omnitrophota bacterium]